jgi:hypothetical protein
MDLQKRMNAIQKPSLNKLNFSLGKYGIRVVKKIVGK